MSEPIRILTRLTAVSATLGAVSCNYAIKHSCPCFSATCRSTHVHMKIF